ncbi:hypothetical protein [Streptosporangium lutulentum]|uniref:Lipopolysaccharide export LptBFGC system permease protein LptF n=1 Tax=Streptosporangium lutulentum TaxID=1461250 RepID=A0ABT9Q7Z4_9ACTN|nr:hypothetical protein [Streptosporangium lutulentum]MDP9842847.1 lipopolysaccharide export LptBFGC system permease protein LptF [Streptosporangium lutulentum]
MRKPLNVWLIVSCIAFIVLLALTLGAGISQRWPLFLASIVLTAVAATCALVTGEWLTTLRRGGSAEPRSRARHR